jgi:hypothetical protein
VRYAPNRRKGFFFVYRIFGVITPLVSRLTLSRILIAAFLALTLVVFLIDPYKLTPHIRNTVRGLALLLFAAFVFVRSTGKMKTP